MVYSSNAGVRRRVQHALGWLPHNLAAPLEFVDAATHHAALEAMSSGSIDLAILDAESAPAGGIGLAKQLKDELLQCPPMVILIAREEDTWLTVWAGADAVAIRTFDAIGLTEAVVPLLRGRLVL